MTRKALRQKARRRAFAQATGGADFQDLYGRELLRLGVGGDSRRTPKPQWWGPGQSPNRWNNENSHP